MTRIKRMMILLALIVFVGGISIGYFYKKNNALQNQARTIFSPPQEIAKFSLIDASGRPFNHSSFWGHWTFIFFGFTGCVQNCPPVMSNLKQMYQILLDQKQNPMPQVMFISINPEQDTLQMIGSYVQSFNPNFQGATGDKTELDKLSSNINVLNQKDNNIVFLIDPAGKLTAIFSKPRDPKQIAKDFQLIVANSG